MTERGDMRPELQAEQGHRDHVHVIGRDENAILYDNRTQVETFADGIGQTTFGPSVSKLRFFRVISVTVDGGKVFETRELSADVVVPTPALLQFLVQMATQLEGFIPVLEAQAQQNVQLLKEFIEVNKK